MGTSDHVRKRPYRHLKYAALSSAAKLHCSSLHLMGGSITGCTCATLIVSAAALCPAVV